MRVKLNDTSLFVERITFISDSRIDVCVFVSVGEHGPASAFSFETSEAGSKKDVLPGISLPHFVVVTHKLTLLLVVIEIVVMLPVLLVIGMSRWVNFVRVIPKRNVDAMSPLGEN